MKITQFNLFILLSIIILPSILSALPIAQSQPDIQNTAGVQTELLSTNTTTDEQTPKKKEDNIFQHFLQGGVKGLNTIVSNVANVFIHPVETIKAVSTVFAKPVSTVKAMSNNLQKPCEEHEANCAGQTVVMVGSMFIPGMGELGVAGKVADGALLAATVSKIGSTTEGDDQFKKEEKDFIEDRDSWFFQNGDNGKSVNGDNGKTNVRSDANGNNGVVVVADDDVKLNSTPKALILGEDESEGFKDQHS